MMETLLILRNIKVENANAIAGLTWGFPAISNFLGFTHALSRKLAAKQSLELLGCGVVCHQQQVLTHQPRGWGDHFFSLTRNPLTKKEKSPSFVEEGRMHMTVSLLIPCKGELDDDMQPGEQEDLIKQHVYSQRLAGGAIIDIESVELEEPPENHEAMQKFERQQLRKLLPGFALVQRDELLARHIREKVAADPEAGPLEAWLDFSAIKYQADREDSEGGDEPKTNWRYIAKPGGGWLVPICVGYRSISDLYPPGEVARSRDASTPFRFVESVYSIGEWISPHRATRLNQLIWTYDAEPQTGWYLCRNSYLPKNTPKQNT